MTLTLSFAPMLPLLASACLPDVASAQALAGSQAPQISEYVRGVFQDRDGDFWFGTNGDGVCRYDGKSFTSYSRKDGLAGNEVRCIVGDRQGRIWIGTEGHGASCYDGKTFRNWTARDGLNNDRIDEMLEDRDARRNSCAFLPSDGPTPCSDQGSSAESVGVLQSWDKPCHARKRAAGLPAGLGWAGLGWAGLGAGVS